MRNVPFGFLLSFLMLGALLLPAGMASAQPAEPGENAFNMNNPRLLILPNCAFTFDPDAEFIFTGTGEIDFPADTPFWVRHGWFAPGWSDLPFEEKRAFMSSATKFVLQVDGVEARSRMVSPHVETFFGFEDVKLKSFYSEFRDGMSGTAVFTGMWFFDESHPFFGGELGVPVPFTKCDLTVNFAP